MDIQIQKLELIKMLMNIESSSILEEIREVISKRTANQENEIITDLLKQSEQEFLAGSTENFENILNESKEKYFK